MKTLIIIINVVNIMFSQGSFVYLGPHGAQFKSYDNNVWWYLSYEKLGFIPQKGETYTVIYDNNNTEQDNYCTHEVDECDNCWREDDKFITITH